MYIFSGKRVFAVFFTKTSKNFACGANPANFFRRCATAKPAKNNATPANFFPHVSEQLTRAVDFLFVFGLIELMLTRCIV